MHCADAWLSPFRFRRCMRQPYGLYGKEEVILMVVFDKPGAQHTEQTLSIAIEQAQAQHAPIVVATYSGQTALTLCRMLEEGSLSVPVYAVRGAAGFHKPGFKMEAEVEARLQAYGVQLISGSHVLSGAERGLSRKYQGIYPVEIIAHTLRMLGQGTKVCVECSVMALDGGYIPEDMPVIAVGGTGQGADTCLCLTPAHASAILQTKIHDIYCKPSLL